MSTNHPVLYHRARTGAIHSWRVWVDGDTIYSEHGQVDGEKIISNRKATPKNTGRKNATTAEQQAELEAKAMWVHKKDRKYSLSPDEAQEEVLLPMLAQPFEKHEKKIQYPVDIQKKLDGVRAMARWQDGKVVLISRQGKLWEATTHLNEELATWLPQDAVMDGEIYLHGKPLQWITSRAKKKQEGTDLLEYRVYDCPEYKGDADLSWTARKAALEELKYQRSRWGSSNRIQIVPTWTCNLKEEVKQYHDLFVEQGYEGAIVRILDAEYEYGHRSPSLLKVKAFEDSEFEIVGHTHGEGIESDMVIWICRNDVNDLTFETRPRGSHDERRQLFKEAANYYGEKLTCRYLGRNESGLPHHAIGHAIRLKEDM